MKKPERHYCIGCPYFYKSGKDETVQGKHLKDFSFYCTGDELTGGYPQFIKTVSCFTGLTPKWCPRMEERAAACREE